MSNKESGISRILVLAMLTSALLGVRPSGASEGPVWPAAPEKARVAWVGEIICEDLEKQRGFLGGVARVLWGADEEEVPALPFDLIADGDRIYMTCQEFPFLVIVDTVKRKFTLHECSDQPMISPVAVVKGHDAVYVSDSGRGYVYRLYEDSFEPWITEGLVRPTGLACSSDGRRIYVVDTGDHSLKIYDELGTLIGEPQSRGEKDHGLNFPTFATMAGEKVLVNDTMNYRIKLLDQDGKLLTSFGEEGNGPGTFARPKGVGVDADGNIWVVDALFDNIQIFDPDGRLLLVIGGRGNGKGEFWSPGGIAVDGNLVYVADTFNNRVQILRYLGGDNEE